MTYTKPVDVGDKVQIEIQNMGQQGDGIGRINKYVIIVKQTDPPEVSSGKVFNVRIIRIFDKFAIAEVIGEVIV